MPTSFADIDHLLKRAGFGGSRAQIESLVPMTWNDAVEAVLDDSGYPSSNVGLPNLDPGRSWWLRYVDMTHFWLDRAATIDIPLGEKMVLFWHGLLCSSLGKTGDHQAMFDQNQLFRNQGLGNFRTLLQAASIQPAMIMYLDNDRNRVGRPNENFARELMELFTLGFDEFTESDVRESARAWTGYGLDDNDNYLYDSSRHDHDPKTFMGVTQAWNGPQIIDYILDGPTRTQVGRHLMGKLFAFFAYPGAPQLVIDELAASATAVDFDIKGMLRAVFRHPEFRSPAAKQGLVRPPIDLAVAIMRRTGMTAGDLNPEWSLGDMGQRPFYPPNVSGWKQNEAWISASTNWARASFYSRVRWRQYEADVLLNSNQFSVPQAVINALELYGIYQPSDKTRSLLESYVTRERSEGGSWSERSGLLYLPLTTPEFQLA